jgi:predicted Zn-dependent protease
MICEFVLLKFKNKVVQVIGVGSPTLKKEIHQSVCGFRLANREETQSLKLYELQITTAKGNETIEKLTLRMGNKLDPSITAVINDKMDKTQFKEGELVKIVKVTPYQPRQ